jgi:hypothetical protein
MADMAHTRRQRLTTVAANATLFYPFLAVAALYGCWLLASRILGHAPIAWIDDPAETLSRGGLGWLYFVVTWLVVVGMFPAFLASVVSNYVHILKRRSSAVQAGIRAMTVVGVWLWFWMWIRTDPHEIIKWWMD